MTAPASKQIKAKWQLQLVYSGPVKFQPAFKKFFLTLKRQIPLIKPQKFIGPYQVTVNLINDQKIRELNKRYRQQKVATDVLAFSLQTNKAKFIEAPTVRQDLGEIFINYQQAQRQAKEQGDSLQQELKLLLIHGLLHLIGLNHQRLRERRAMESQQQKLLSLGGE